MVLRIIPTMLEGHHIQLEPLTFAHENELIAGVCDGEMWKIWTTRIPAPDEMKTYIAKAIEDQATGFALPFAIRRKIDQKIVGSTRYMNIEAAHRRLEIGTTWVAKSAQRTAVNSEAKLLLLTHAFETLGCLAVELRTDVLNLQSRTAIERLGAQPEGILRKHRIMPDGRIRDTIIYSILDDEWPGVKNSLAARIARG